MPENETCEREQKSAAASYRNIPMWMRRIEKKTRRSKDKNFAATKPIETVSNRETANAT